jgi:hypothetical protein
VMPDSFSLGRSLWDLLLFSIGKNTWLTQFAIRLGGEYFLHFRFLLDFKGKNESKYTFCF